MKKYILITDIGRDTDDTLALIILLYLHKIKKIKLKNNDTIEIVHFIGGG